MWWDIFHADRNGRTHEEPFPTRYCHLFKQTAGINWWKLRSFKIILCIFRTYLASIISLTTFGSHLPA